MFMKTLISRKFSVLFIVMFLLSGVVPARAELLSSSLYASGDLAWATSIGGTLDDWGYSVAMDSNGNIYTMGRFHGTVDVDPGADTFNLTSVLGSDTFVSRLDSNHNFIWAKHMGGNGRIMALDSSGNVYTTGIFNGTVDFDPGAGTANLTSAAVQDVFVTKLDGNGDFVWARSMGGADVDNAYSIAVDSSGNVYTMGIFNGTADFDPGAGTFNLTSAGNDIFVSKLDSNGDFVWAKSMSGSGGSMALDSGGNVYTTGSFGGTADFDPGAGTFNLTSAGGDDIFVSKLDSSGDFVWAKSMGGTFAGEAGLGIAVDSSDIYTTGIYVATADFDPGAGTFNLTSAGGIDIFVSKLDSSGNFVWAKSMGGVSNSDIGRHIALDSSGGVYTTGIYQDTADFDPGAGTANLTSAGASDIFVSKLDSNGNFLEAKSVGGASFDGDGGIALDSSSSVYMIGSFQSTADFDPGAGTLNLTSAGGSDIFVFKLQGSSNQVVQVAIDIMPGNRQNRIDPKSRGRITVAILSASDFDALTMVDRTSLTFGHTGTEDSLVSCAKRGRDVNHDGLKDLLCDFRIRAAAFQTGDTVGILQGMTLAGTPIIGQDSLKIKIPSQDNDHDD